MSSTFCPATMCPLFAAGGSPWTGEQNTACHGATCGWFRDGRCTAADHAHQQVADLADGEPIAQQGPVRVQKLQVERKTFECPRAHECQWQIEAEAEGVICPPRAALMLGVDPRACAY